MSYESGCLTENISSLGLHMILTFAYAFGLLEVKSA